MRRVACMSMAKGFAAHAPGMHEAGPGVPGG